MTRLARILALYRRAVLSAARDTYCADLALLARAGRRNALADRLFEAAQDAARHPENRPGNPVARPFAAPARKTRPELPPNAIQAISALRALGYPSREASQRVEAVQNLQTLDTPSIVTLALKRTA